MTACSACALSTLLASFSLNSVPAYHVAYLPIQLPTPNTILALASALLDERFSLQAIEAHSSEAFICSCIPSPASERRSSTRMRAYCAFTCEKSLRGEDKDEDEDERDYEALIVHGPHIAFSHRSPRLVLHQLTSCFHQRFASLAFPLTLSTCKRRHLDLPDLFFKMKYPLLCASFPLSSISVQPLAPYHSPGF